MRAISIITLLVAGAAIGDGVVPLSAQRKIQIYGAAIDGRTISCGRFVSLNGSLREYVSNWLDGFVSGADYGLSLNSSSDTLANVGDGYALEEWVRKYCRDHPLDDFPTAAFELVTELKHRNQR